MTRPGYKMTEIGELPDDWRVDKISKLKISMFYGITAKSTKDITGLKFLRTTDISNFNFDYENLTYCNVTENKQNMSKYYLKRNDIIVARAGTVGVSVLVDRDLRDTIFGSYLIKIVFNDNLINTKFVHHYFQSRFYWNKILTAQGSTIKNINLPFLDNLLIPVPPLPEQQKIAKILSSADESIQKVNEEIALTERLKKGLMQTLLTKGIGHTKFKMTEIGKIPEEWSVKRLEEIADVISGGTPATGKEEFWKDGNIPWVKSGKCADDVVNTPDGFINEKGLLNSSAKLLKKETVLLAMVGATVGKTGFLTFEACTNQNVAGIYARNPDTILQKYIFYMLQSRYSEFTKNKGFFIANLSFIRNLFVPIPSFDEQLKISDVFSTVDNKLELLRKKKEHLEKLKKGLMNDLLTGKVRVKSQTSKGDN